MTETETQLLKDYNKMLLWLVQETDSVELEGMQIDARLIPNENLRNKFFKIEKDVNEFYGESDENKIELQKIWDSLDNSI